MSIRIWGLCSVNQDLLRTVLPTNLTMGTTISEHYFSLMGTCHRHFWDRVFWSVFFYHSSFQWSTKKASIRIQLSSTLRRSDDPSTLCARSTSQVSSRVRVLQFPLKKSRTLRLLLSRPTFDFPCSANILFFSLPRELEIQIFKFLKV